MVVFSNVNEIKNSHLDGKALNVLAMEMSETGGLEATVVVPGDYDDNPKLATWVGLQRKQYRLKQMGRPSHILEERISLLNNLGFTWNAKEATWDKRFEELKEYKEQFGVCTVPLSEDFFQLGRWVSFSYGMEPIVFCCAITPPHIPTLLLS